MLESVKTTTADATIPELTPLAKAAIEYTQSLIELNTVALKLSSFLYDRRASWPQNELGAFAEVFLGTGALTEAFLATLNVPIAGIEHNLEVLKILLKILGEGGAAK